MHQQSEIPSINDRVQKKVFYHLKLADILLIGLPMAVVAVSLILLTLSCGADMLCAGVAVGSLILIFLFCGVYGTLAVILSFITLRNITFRISLAGSLLAIAGGIAVLLR
jgi:hypothetical protein